VKSVVSLGFRALVAVRTRCWNLIGRYLLRLHGVHFGRNLSLLGFPIVSLAEGSSIKIGQRVVLCSDSRYTALGVSRPVILRTLAPTAEIQIGDDVGASGVVICAAVAVRVGARCLIGAEVKIVDIDFHAIEPVGRRYGSGGVINSSAVHIEDDVFIGAGAMVLKGVTIGAGSVIAAGSVVTRDVPPMSIAAGIPARVIGSVSAPMLPQTLPEHSGLSVRETGDSLLQGQAA